MIRIVAWGTGIVVALVLLLFAITYPRIQSLSDVGAGFVAMQMCSCVEVLGRSFDDCLPDMRPEMDAVRSERIETDGRRGVRAWVPIYAERSAYRAPPDGCVLE